MAKAENFIHIKFNYSDALESKRDILSTELDLVKIKKTLMNYIHLRNKELSLKEELNQKLNSVKIDLNKLKRNLPKIKIPKLLEEPLEIEERYVENPVTKITPKKQLIRSPETDGLDSQLLEIQNRLKALE